MYHGPPVTGISGIAYLLIGLAAVVGGAIGSVVTWFRTRNRP